MATLDIKPTTITADQHKDLVARLRANIFDIYKATDFLEIAQQGGFERAEPLMTKNRVLTEEGKEAMKGIF